MELKMEVIPLPAPIFRETDVFDYYRWQHKNDNDFSKIYKGNFYFYFGNESNFLVFLPL